MPCLIQRILTFKEAVSFPTVRIIGLDGVDKTGLYKYAWSVDGACWTAWVDYGTYRQIAKNLEGDFYLRVLVNDSIGEVYINEHLTQCYSLCLLGHTFEDLACENPNLFDPYANLDCALLLQQQLADSVVCMLGIPVYYFRVEPDQSSKDWTFKEYVLHNVVACKQIKLMITDGQLPSSNPKLSELDFDWETDWETEVSKTQFARAFGDNVFPKARDFLYIPMMRRMWEVNAAYDERNEGLLWRSTTWKLSLVKYNESTNTDTGEFEEIIDNLLTQYSESFETNENIEQDRQSGSAQISAPRFAATNLYNLFMEDAVRKAYTRNDVSILDKIYCHHNTIVARNLYKFRNENGCVTYQKGLCGDSGMIGFILETAGHLNGDTHKDIANFGPIHFEVGYTDKQFTVGVEELVANLEPFSTYLVIYRWDRNTFTKELSIYKHVHRTDFPIYKLKPEQFWFDLENPVAELVGPYNNDYILDSEQSCQIHGWPVQMTNVRIYNRPVDHDEAIRESLKYTTTDERCVMADLARPINSGRGFEVR